MTLPTTLSAGFERVVDFRSSSKALDGNSGTWHFAQTFDDTDCGQLAAFDKLRVLGLVGTSLKRPHNDLFLSLVHLEYVDLRNTGHSIPNACSPTATSRGRAQRSPPIQSLRTSNPLAWRGVGALLFEFLAVSAARMPIGSARLTGRCAHVQASCPCHPWSHHGRTVTAGADRPRRGRLQKKTGRHWKTGCGRRRNGNAGKKTSCPSCTSKRSAAR